MQSRHVQLSVAQLGMLAAMTTLTIGAALGVIMGIYLKGLHDPVPRKAGSPAGDEVILFLSLRGTALAWPP